MKDKFFLDTNIIVYSFDELSSAKRRISEKLIKEALSGKGSISFQVIQEFLNTATKKFESPMNSDEAEKYLSKVLFPFCSVFPSEELYIHSLDIKERWHYSFYDSLIIASALEADCTVLYSEDLQHNQKIYGLTVLNPFN